MGAKRHYEVNLSGPAQGRRKYGTLLDYLPRNNLAAVGDFYEGEVPSSQPEELVVYLKTNMNEEDLVFSHGNICDSNIIISKDSQDINGYIDWGREGKADRWYDIAFCVRSIREDLGNEDYIKYFNARR